MEIRRLKYFVRIAEDGSLTKAAGVLRIAQPALSRQIRLLEQEVGVPLFSRTARGMQLTEEGEYLRDSVSGALRTVELALQNVRSLARRFEGDFAIGMPASLADTLATPLVLSMSSDFPNIKLRIVEALTGSLIDWLHRGVIDFALLEEESRDDLLTDRELFSERLMVVGAAGSSLDPKRALSFERVTRLPLILPMHHLGIRAIFNDALAKARSTADIRFEADSFKLTKELATRGMGYALLPLSHFRHEYERGTLIYAPIVKPALTLTTFLSYRTNSRSSTGRVEGLVIETMTRMLGEMRKP